MAFAQDAATFLADWATATTWQPTSGGQAVLGVMIFDQPDTVIDGGDSQSTQYAVTFETTAWPGLKRGEVLVIDGHSYKLRTDPRAQDDGVFSIVNLTRVA